jgi:hypothetical protein
LPEQSKSDKLKHAVISNLEAMGAEEIVVEVDPNNSEELLINYKIKLSPSILTEFSIDNPNWPLEET